MGALFIFVEVFLLDNCLFSSILLHKFQPPPFPPNSKLYPFNSARAPYMLYLGSPSLQHGLENASKGNTGWFGAQLVCFPSLRDHILALPIAQDLTAVPWILLTFLAIYSRKKSLVPVTPLSPEVEIYIIFYKVKLLVFKSNVNKFFWKNLSFVNNFEGI